MDATVPMDAGALDGGDDDGGGPVPSCIPSESDRYDREALTADPSTFSLLAAPAGFGLAYEVSTCGSGIDVMRFASRGGEFTPLTVVNDPNQGSCSRAHDPALFYEEPNWRLFFWDNRGGSNQLWSVVIDSGEEPTLEVESAENGRTPLVTRLAGVTYLGWAERSTGTGFFVRPLSDTDATPTTVLATGDAHQAFGFAFSGIEQVGAVAWVDAHSTSRGAFLQPLTATGELSGERVTLTTLVSTRSSVDLVDGAMNAAVVYSTVVDNAAFEVRFQTLDETGRPAGNEERIVTRSERGTDASIAKIGSGYVVAYRELPAVADGTAKVKLILIDKTGRRLGPAAHVADTTDSGGRVTVRSSFDGRFTVAWVEADANSQRLRVVRIPCR